MILAALVVVTASAFLVIVFCRIQDRADRRFREFAGVRERERVNEALRVTATVVDGKTVFSDGWTW